MPTALVIDDDDSLRDTVSLLLEQAGYQTYVAANGRDGFETALRVRPDLVLVDLRLPMMDGTEVCKQIRASGLQVPIIVLSAVGEEVDKVLLLELGADDYVVKPFGARELLARVKAVLRRTALDSQRLIKFSTVVIDIERRVVVRDGESIKLTPAEYNLLLYFVHNPDRVLSRDNILNSVWGYESFPNTRTVDAHVLKLRQKLEPDASVPRHFVTVHGVGYRFLP